MVLSGGIALIYLSLLINFGGILNNFWKNLSFSLFSGELYFENTFSSFLYSPEYLLHKLH